MGANAQTSVPAFTAGQVLTAAQMTQVNTGIPVFASSTERDAAFGGAGEKTLAEGQYAYLEDVNQTQVYDGSSWVASGGKILQVVSTTKTDTFSASLAAGADADVTGLSVTITPSSATSKIMLFANVVGAYGGGARFGWRFVRDSTDIAVGDAAGNRTPVTSVAIASSTAGDAAENFIEAGGSFLDSPATTSAITYKIQVVQVTTGSGTQTLWINRSNNWSDLSRIGIPVSTITAMEVSV